jgi:hypothetical protein
MRTLCSRVCARRPASNAYENLRAHRHRERRDASTHRPRLYVYVCIDMLTQVVAKNKKAEWGMRNGESDCIPADAHSWQTLRFGGLIPIDRCP